MSIIITIINFIIIISVVFVIIISFIIYSKFNSDWLKSLANYL